MEEPDLDDFYAIQRYVNDSATHIANKTKEMLATPEFDPEPESSDEDSDEDPNKPFGKDHKDPFGDETSEMGCAMWKMYWEVGAKLADLIDFCYTYSREKQDVGSRSIQAQIHRFIDALVANFYLLEERSPISKYLQVPENVDDIREWRIKLATYSRLGPFSATNATTNPTATTNTTATTKITGTNNFKTGSKGLSRTQSRCNSEGDMSSSLSLSSRRSGWTCSDTGSEWNSEFESEYSAYSESECSAESEDTENELPSGF